MIVQQLYTNCLAEAAYYIESDGEAVIIDHIRETKPYLDLLKERGANLKYVFETHFHADFVSGHIDLSRKTGAPIVFGPGANPDYEVYHAKDGEVFNVGKAKLKAIHTPGHTPESTCYLLFDENGKEHAVFTGDTLFVGDVGRPDLLDGKMSKEELAGMLYDSLNKKIKVLPDDVIVYPAHGPGSACGKSIGTEKQSTIGEQKVSNYALADIDKASFIKSVTDGLVAPPAYFFEDARINKTGYSDLDSIISQNLKPLSLDAFKALVSEGAEILDTRIPDEFEKEFIPGSINIGLNGQFAVWAGTLLKIDKKIVLVTAPGKEEESVVRLARVGFENVAGYLDGGVAAWKKSGGSTDQIKSITPEALKNEYANLRSQILDVRKSGEYQGNHVAGATLFSLDHLLKNINDLDKSNPYVIHCAGGYRSMIAASILRAHGFKNLTNVYGGFSKIQETGIPLESGK
jgi:hydroxyacylglutathione hydrolase